MVGRAWRNGDGMFEVRGVKGEFLLVMRVWIGS